MVSNGPPDALTFGDLLRQQRRVRELTQETLAARAGVSVRAISDLERGARTHPYRETAKLLATALGLSGSERTAFLAAGRGPLRSVGRPELLRGGAPLPRPLTRLIGRRAELGELVRLLRDDYQRLITLTGPAGVGKTRLVLAVAAALEESFAGDVVFVDLAPLRNPSLVAPALAAALGLPDQGSIPAVEILRRALRTRSILLILDNYEHLLEAAPVVSELVQAGPGVQVLVTSRTVLRLRGEHEVRLAPMPTPDPGASLPPHELGRWEAIQLFVERARSAQPAFQLTAENAAEVVAICQRLDGLPLAIELAAARSKLLPPAALLQRLERLLPILTGGLRDAPPRQHTLQAAITWSYDLLAPHEQALFRCLAVFSGGWTLAAAEEVGDLSGVSDTLEALTGLCEQSLVARNDDGPEPRYRMLETIHEFAGEQLDAAGEAARARKAHVHYLYQLAHKNDLERLDAEFETRLNRLVAEEANLRAGIEWAIAHDPDSALAILVALSSFWEHADRPAVGRELYERVLSTRAGEDQPEQARAMQQTASLMSYVGDMAAAGPLAEAARSLADQLGDERTSAHSQMIQGNIALSRGDDAEAKSLLEAASARFTALGDDWGIYVSLNQLGIAALDRGDGAAAVRAYQRMLAIAEKLQLPGRFKAHPLGSLAEVYRHLGQHDAAMETCIEALALAPVTARSINACVHLTLGRLLLERDDLAQAVPLVVRCLDYYWEIGDWWNLAHALEATAAVMAAGCQAAVAVRCFGAAGALRIAMPYPIGALADAIVSRQLAQVRSGLGEPAFANAWTAGQTQSLAESVAEAQVVLATLAR